MDVRRKPVASPSSSTPSTASGNAAASTPAAAVQVPAQTSTSSTAHAPAAAASAPEKRFDVYSAPASSTQHAPQPGRRAQLDLRGWTPAPLRAALLKDIAVTYDLLVKLPPAVTFFGGARIKPEDPYYAISKDIGAALAAAGAPVRTGAGPGIMTSIPEGFKSHTTGAVDGGKFLDASLQFHPVVAGMSEAAKSDDTRTQGFRIKLPFEQEWSEYIDVGAQQTLFPYRKLSLYENTRGCVVFPGGYGTLDEMFEVWSAAEQGALHKPLAAVGTDFWRDILGPIEKATVGRGLVDKRDFERMFVTDSPGDLVSYLARHTDDVKAFDKPALERAKKLGREIDETVALLDRMPPAVTFLGGRRLRDDDAEVKLARDVAAKLARDGVPLRVGAGGVIAEAVCDGAARGRRGAEVQGVLLGGLQGTRALPNLKVLQQVDEQISHKECVGRRSSAFVALPGGLNTLAEVFSTLTQIQCGHLPRVPIVLVGKDFWQPIFDGIKARMLSPERKTIAPEDLDLFVITDDPEEIAKLCADASTHKERAPVAAPRGMAGQLVGGDNAQLWNPPGPALAPWLRGASAASSSVARGSDTVAPGIDSDRTLARAAVDKALPAAWRASIDARGIDVRHVAWALDHGTTKEAVGRLLQQGAGRACFEFLYACAPWCAYRRPEAAAQRILHRWGDRAELAFQRTTHVTTSSNLQNPDAMKVWLEALGDPGPSGERAASALSDAWDLVSAGHRICVQEHARGVGDIIDLTSSTTYQHRRVTSSHLAPALRDAALRLQDAPSGTAGVVQLDVRGNASLQGRSDDEIASRIAALELPTARLDRVQVLLDDRLLVLERGQRLVARHDPA